MDTSEYLPMFLAEGREHLQELNLAVVRIEEQPDGYRLVIRCESGCPAPVVHAEDVGEVPLGLFQLWDGDGLLLSTWAAASVYVVRAHLLSPRGVRPVLEAASRGAPALALDGQDGVVALAAGTDGTDGPTDAAGAVVDGGSARRARERDLDPRASLDANDSNPVLAATGDLVVTGPTNTNLLDLYLLLIDPR